MPVADRVVGALLALQRKRIQRLAGYVLHRRDGVGADALVALRMMRAQAFIAGVDEGRRLRVGDGGRVAHHLRPARDGEIGHARHDRRGRKVHRRDARSAEPVDGDARRAHIVARIQRRHAAKVAPLLADLRGRAPDDVVHIRRVDARALGQRLQHGGPQMLRVHVGQRALALPANAARRAAGVDDPGFGHG